jgi:uncharacterized protein (TIGR02118 family)
MVKVMFGWRDRPDLSPEECDRAYRESHIPLAQAAFAGVPGFRRLVYNRVQSHFVVNHNQRDATEPRDTDFAAFVEIHFDSQEQLDAAMSRDIMQGLFDDHPKFMLWDIPANVRGYSLNETVVLEATDR